MTKLVIVGAGGHGREMLDIVEASSDGEQAEWDFLGFVDDGEVDEDRLGRRAARAVRADDLDPASVRYIAGVGDSTARERIDERMRAAGFEAATLVHPSASVGGDVRLAPGVVLAAGARVTTNVALGRHTQLNIGACVSHDCVLGDYVTLSPGTLVNGECSVGDRAFFGTGSIITPRTRIGAGATVGAGAVVLADVPAGTTVVGVPARPA